MRVDQLDLNLLAVLDALLAHGNATRAAEQLNMAQPTISSALARLRHYFHDELIVASGRRMVPTPLACRLRDPVASLLLQARVIARSRAGFDPATSDAGLTIVASDYVAMVLVAELSRELARLAPAITLRLLQLGQTAEQRFGAGQVDLMVVPAGALDPVEFEAPLIVDPLVAVAWEDSDHANQPLSLDAFLKADHAVVEFGEVGAPGVLGTFLTERGLDRRARVRLPNFVMLSEFVPGTQMLAVLPLSFARRVQTRLPIRLLTAEFEMPWLEERVRWPRHLHGDPGNQWLRTLLQAVADRVSSANPASLTPGLDRDAPAAAAR